MQKLALALACCSAFAACDESLATTQPDLQMSMPDLLPAGDLAMRIPNGVVCGGSACNSPKVCCESVSNGTAQASCMASGSCAAGAVAASCDGPEDCAGGGSCCATVGFMLSMVDGGLPTSTGGAATCSAQCMAGLDLGANMITTELCHASADCTGLMGSTILGTIAFDGCCTLPQAGNIQACAPKSFASQFKYTCL